MEGGGEGVRKWMLSGRYVRLGRMFGSELKAPALMVSPAGLPYRGLSLNWVGRVLGWYLYKEATTQRFDEIRGIP
jgi:hypothetical protein